MRAGAADFRGLVCAFHGVSESSESRLSNAGARGKRQAGIVPRLCYAGSDRPVGFADERGRAV
jgi:hypothetical protein